MARGYGLRSYPLNHCQASFSAFSRRKAREIEKKKAKNRSGAAEGPSKPHFMSVMQGAVGAMSWSRPIFSAALHGPMVFGASWQFADERPWPTWRSETAFRERQQSRAVRGLP